MLKTLNFTEVNLVTGSTSACCCVCPSGQSWSDDIDNDSVSCADYCSLNINGTAGNECNYISALINDELIMFGVLVGLIGIM